MTTTPFIVTAFLQPHLAELARYYEVTLVVNQTDGYPLKLPTKGDFAVKHIAIERKLAPARDLAALTQLTAFLARERFDVVHSFAPKAGLLAMAAGVSASIPCRIHTFQGEVWASKTGPMRFLLRSIDSLVARLATHVLVVGRGEQAFLEQQGVLATGKSKVLGEGSIAGVDTARFRPDGEARDAVRRELGIVSDAFVVLYMGRLARDKGVLDLARAFRLLGEGFAEAWLIVSGPDEEDITGAIRQEAGDFASRVRFTGYTDQPEKFLAAADVVCLPSYREGFATVLLEAGACGVPVIASRIYGTEGAIVEWETGVFCEPGNVPELGRMLSLVADRAEWREAAGRKARERMMASFPQSRLVAEMRHFYETVAA